MRANRFAVKQIHVVPDIVIVSIKSSPEFNQLMYFLKYLFNTVDSLDYTIPDT